MSMTRSGTEMYSSLTFLLLSFNIFLITVQQDDSIYESFQIYVTILPNRIIHIVYAYSMIYYNFITSCSF